MRGPRAAFAAGPLGGLLIRASGPTKLGYPLVFGLAFATGMAATLAFARIPEPPLHRRADEVEVVGSAIVQRRDVPPGKWLRHDSEHTVELILDQAGYFV